MKSSYELAMERLNKTAPAGKLTPAQKRQLAELESQYTAKLAGREIALASEIRAATEAGDGDTVEMLRRQLAAERKNLQSDLEDKKEAVRQAPAKS